MIRKNPFYCIVAYLLNLLDLAFTFYTLGMGGVEYNPVVRCMLAVHPLVYVIYKVVAVGLLFLWLHRRPEPIALKGIKLTAVVFAAINLYYIVTLICIYLM